MNGSRSSPEIFLKPHQGVKAWANELAAIPYMVRHYGCDGKNSLKDA
jgi:hypothetical protein